MGNTSKKLAAKCTLLTKEEQKYVAATFRAASKNSERIREDDLIVSGKVDAVLLEVCSFLFSFNFIFFCFFFSASDKVIFFFSKDFEVCRISIHNIDISR
ncbi:hypothetical protein RR46_07978 [Papilio xuthus]|uniref:Uncharacterized protein n=1 Tax=Papilio xuthus TaxID=66420 RepID=A0A194QFN0_PAPXU|nr:hypothetical protein RR46_07978 [Papilio xuthus]